MFKNDKKYGMEKTSEQFFSSVKFAFGLVLLFWIVHFISLIPGISFITYGIYPRHPDGLAGIFLAPFIHGDFHHLISNSTPMLVLTTTIFFFYRRIAFKSFITIYLLTGLAVWLFARRSYHIGASGVVYGLVSFVFWSGIFRKNLKSIVLALIVTVLYSGYFYGILPNQEGISWESHLFGGIIGIFAAYWFRSDIEDDERPKQYSWDKEPENKSFFLDRNTFTQTKAERRQQAQNNPFDF